MPVVIHHPVLDANDSTRFVDPPWANHGLLQAYRLNGVEDAQGGAPDSGGSLYLVNQAKLAKALSDGAILIADDPRDNNLSPSVRSAIETTWGVTIPGDVQSPIDAIIRVVGIASHPDGLLGPKPIMPGADGRFRWVAGRGSFTFDSLPNITRPQKFQPALNSDKSHFATRSKVRDVMLAGVKEALAIDTDHGAKMAGMNLLKFGIAPNELADFATEMIPVEFKGVKPRRPETRYDIPFTAADGATVAGFTKVAGAWSIASNKLENDTPGGNANVSVRYDSALSGVDHYCAVDATWESASSSWAGACARFRSNDFISYTMFGGAVADVTGLARFVSGGSGTNLITASLSIGAQTSRIYLKVDGSVLFGSIGGTTHTLAFTDTVLNSETQFGIWALALTSGNNHKFDNLTGEDFSGGETVAHLIGSGRVR